MKLKKIVALAVALTLALSSITGAFATYDGGSILDVDSSNIVSAGEVIGTLSDQDGFLLPDAPATRSLGALFSMTAVRVSNLLTTYQVNGKSFTGGNMDAFAGEGLKISGTGTTSTGTGNIKVGACYYQSYNDTFVSVCSYPFTPGTSGEKWWPKTTFSNSITYYGHVTNPNGTGTVAGTFNFAVTTDPNA